MSFNRNSHDSQRSYHEKLESGCSQPRKATLFGKRHNFALMPCKFGFSRVLGAKISKSWSELDRECFLESQRLYRPTPLACVTETRPEGNAPTVNCSMQSATKSKNGSQEDGSMHSNLCSSISYQEDEFFVTRFIDTSVSYELLSDTPVKAASSESSQKIVKKKPVSPDSADSLLNFCSRKGFACQNRDKVLDDFDAIASLKLQLARFSDTEATKLATQNTFAGENPELDFI